MDGNLAYKLEPREEIIGGEVVMMASPSLAHNFISLNIYSIFNGHLRGKTCTPIGDGTDLYLTEDEERYVPDGMVVCDPDKLRRNGVHGAPDLVVEVLSPSTARYDRGRKKDVYEAHGIREYWIVDPVSRNVEQYVLEDGKFVLRDVYHQYTPAELADMKEKERSEVVTEFRCGLFDDLVVRLEDVFYRVGPGL